MNKVRLDRVDAYLAQIESDKKSTVEQLREVVLAHLPDGFEEQMNYGMLSYVVPHKLYPTGYHCDAKLPLPFMAIAANKRFVGLYHMGLYANEEIMSWFKNSYETKYNRKLDAGKSCLRFSKKEHVPFELISELASKISVKSWIEQYEKNIKR